jgi:hypothetical protein
VFFSVESHPSASSLFTLLLTPNYMQFKYINYVWFWPPALWNAKERLPLVRRWEMPTSFSSHNASQPKNLIL